MFSVSVDTLRTVRKSTLLRTVLNYFILTVSIVCPLPLLVIMRNIRLILQLNII